VVAEVNWNIWGNWMKFGLKLVDKQVNQNNNDKLHNLV